MPVVPYPVSHRVNASVTKESGGGDEEELKICVHTISEYEWWTSGFTPPFGALHPVGIR